MLIQQKTSRRVQESLKEEFFALIDLSRADLQDVKSAADRNDYDLAAERFLAYMRQRQTPHFYREWDKPQRQKDHDTSAADKVVNGHLVQVDIGKHIDWHANPFGDPEWTYCLNRHEYLTTLGRAYWHTGNEKYTKAFKEILTDWINKNPMPDVEWMLQIPKEQSRSHFMQQGNWRPLTLGIRLYTAWCPCYYHFLESPLFTPDFHIRMLYSMGEHARHLRWYYTRHVNYFNVSPNWGLMEANGLAHMGILFPEFREAEDWCNTALSRLEEQVRMQVLPDGVHVERCSGYHLVSTFCILQIAELAQRNGMRLSQTWLDNLEKMVDYVLYLLKPHGVFPMLSDGDESDVLGDRASYGLWEDINNLNMLEDGNDLRYVLKAGARMFNRPDMLYAATCGAEGKKPNKLAAAFPDGGFYVSRTGWDKDDKYMAINCGLLGVYDQNCVHAHADALSVDISAYGKTRIIDPGRYMYEGPFRVWFKSSKAHNTVVVDGQDQSELRDEWLFNTWAVATMRHWVTSSSCDYFDGSHNGYERLEQPVTHRRRILFVKPDYWVVLDELTGSGKHDFDLYWHFTEDARVQVDSAGARALVAYDDDVCLAVLPLSAQKLSHDVQIGAEDPIQGWVSYDYAVKMPAPCLRYHCRAQAPAKFVTVLAPSRDAVCEMKAAWDGRRRVEVQTPKGKDVIIFNDGVEREHDEFVFDGEALCARFAEDGTLQSCFSANSSLVKHNDKILFDGTCRVKQETFETNGSLQK